MKRLTPYLLLLPQLVVGAIFFIGIIIGITWSFGVIPIFGLYKPDFKYYLEIFARPDTLSSILYSLKISFLSSVISVVIGVFLAYLMILLLLFLSILFQPTVCLHVCAITSVLSMTKVNFPFWSMISSE